MNKFKRMLQVAFGALFLVCVMLFAASCNLFGTSEPPTDDTVYAVTVSMNDESLGEVTLEGDKVGDGYRAGSKLKVTVIPIEDYEAELAINGESVELDEQGSVEVVVNEALAIDADFEYIYTVNVVNDDLKGTVVIGPEEAYDETTGLYAKDAQLTVTVTPKTNFVVAGIKHNGADVQFTPDAETGACSFTFTLSERAYITVEYTALHEVKLTQNGEGAVKLDGADFTGVTVEEGTEVTLTLSPASGFILGDVYVNGALTPVTEDGTVTFTVKGETEVTVNFVALRRVYVQQCLGDAVTATSCGTVEVTGETYNTPLSKHAAEGDTLTVHAVPDEDYTLEKITVNGEEIDAVNGIGSFTVKGDKDGRVYVRVYWAKKLYTIEYSSGDAQIRGDLLLVNKAFPKNTYESGESLPSGIEVNLKMTPKPGFTVEFLRINNDTIYYVGKSNKLVYDDAGSWLYTFTVKSDLEMHVEFKEAPHFDIDLDNGLAEKGASLSEPTTQLGALNVTLKDSNGGEHTIPNPYYDEELADKYYYGEKITVSAGEGNIFTEDVVLKDKTGAEFDRIPIQEKDWLNEVSFYATRETVVSTNVKLLTHNVTINYGNGIDESVTFNVKHDFKLNLKDLTANADLKTEGGDPVTLVNPVWADHRLVGWRVEGSEDLIDVEELFVVEKDDVVINAVWQETYVLTVTVSGINGVEGARVELTIVDTKTKEPIADRGPIDDVTTDGVQTFVLDKGMSMKAEAYAPITHKIDIWNGLGIWVTPNPEATEVHVGLTLNGDIGIVFAPYNHNVTLTSNKGGAATLTNGEDPVETPAEIPNGTTLTLKAVPDATYRVKSVKVNGDEIELNAENVYSIRITEPTEIEVEFVKTYTVTIQIDGDTTLGEVHVYKVTEDVETELENGSLFDEGDTIKVVMSENDEDNEHIWVVLYADMDVRLYNPEYPDSYDGYYGPEDGVSQWGEVNETWQGTAKSDIKVHIYLNKYYKVSADYDQTQGTIVYGEEEYRFDHEFYVAGAQVALTVKAKEGYRIGAIEAEGVTITADLNALVTSYELTFSMPANEVQITVTYVKTYKVEDCTIITPDLAEDPVTVLYGEGVHGFREDGSPIEGTEMKTGDIVDAGATFCVIVNPVTGYCFSRDSVIKGGNISISGALLNGGISLGYMTITKDVTVHLVIVQRELFDVTMSVKDINHEEENVSDYVKLSDPYFKDTTTKYFYDETVTVNAVEEYQTVEYDEAKGVFTSVTHYYLVKKVTVNGSDVTAGADGKFSFKVKENTDVQVEVVRLFKVDLVVEGDTYNEKPVGHTTFLSGETVYGHDGEAVWIEENSKLDVSVELYNTDFLLTNSLIVSEKEWLSKDEVVYKTEGTGRAGWSVTFSVTHDIYARIKYVRYQFHVTVDPANGEGSSSTEHETRDGFRLPEEPATKPENCRFGGWKVTYADGTPEEIRQPGELLKPSDNITVTAVWVETYTVTLNVTGASADEDNYVVLYSATKAEGQYEVYEKYTGVGGLTEQTIESDGPVTVTLDKGLYICIEVHASVSYYVNLPFASFGTYAEYPDASARGTWEITRHGSGDLWSVGEVNVGFELYKHKVTVDGEPIDSANWAVNGRMFGIGHPDPGFETHDGYTFDKYIVIEGEKTTLCGQDTTYGEVYGELTIYSRWSYEVTVNVKTVSDDPDAVGGTVTLEEDAPLPAVYYWSMDQEETLLYFRAEEGYLVSKVEYDCNGDIGEENYPVGQNVYFSSFGVVGKTTLTVTFSKVYHVSVNITEGEELGTVTITNRTTGQPLHHGDAVYAGSSIYIRIAPETGNWIVMSKMVCPDSSIVMGGGTMNGALENVGPSHLYGDIEIELKFVKGYTVTLDGEAQWPTVMEGASYPLPAAPAAREGQRFLGWQVSGVDGLKQPGEKIESVTADLTVTSSWINTYTVTVNVDGENHGSVVVSDLHSGVEIETVTSGVSKAIDEGSAIKVHITAEEGYWIVLKNCQPGQSQGPLHIYGGNFYGAVDWYVTENLTDNVVLNITYVKNHTVTVDNGDPKNVKEGDSYTLPAAPAAREGQRFVGWQVSGVEELKQPGERIDSVTTDLTVTSSWINTYTITFNVTGGEHGSVEILDYHTGEQIEKITSGVSKPIDEGKAIKVHITFEQGYWAVLKDCNPGISNGPLTLTGGSYLGGGMDWFVTESFVGNAVLNVTWVKNHTVTVDNGEPKNVKEGDSYRLPAAPAARTGYTFAGWDVNGELHSAQDVIEDVREDLVVTSKWTFKVTVENGEGGDKLQRYYQNPDRYEDWTVDETYTEGDAVNFYVTAKPGYRIAKFITHVEGYVNPLVTEFNSSVLTETWYLGLAKTSRVEVVYEKVYMITVTGDNIGEFTVNVDDDAFLYYDEETNTYTLDANTMYAILVTPADGYMIKKVTNTSTGRVEFDAFAELAPGLGMNGGSEQYGNGYAKVALVMDTAFSIETSTRYTVTVDRQSSSLGDFTRDVIENYEYPLPQPGTKDGYRFAGWKVEGIDGIGDELKQAGETITIGASDVTVTAQWVQVVTVSMKVNGESHGTIELKKADGTLVNDGETLDVGTMVSIHIKADDGYKVLIESGAIGFVSITDSLMPEITIEEFAVEEVGISFTVRFEAISYTVSVPSVEGVQSATLDKEEGKYTVGETVQLTVTAETGYKLVSVTAEDVDVSGGEGGVYTFTMPASDVTVTIQVEKQYKVTVADGSSEHAQVNFTDGQKDWYDNGETVEFTVTAIGEYVVTSVKAGSDVLTEEGGKYSVTLNGADVEITVETVEKIDKPITENGDNQGEWKGVTQDAVSLQINADSIVIGDEYVTEISDNGLTGGEIVYNLKTEDNKTYTLAWFGQEADYVLVLTDTTPVASASRARVRVASAGGVSYYVSPAVGEDNYKAAYDAALGGEWKNGEKALNITDDAGKIGLTLDGAKAEYVIKVGEEKKYLVIMENASAAYVLTVTDSGNLKLNEDEYTKKAFTGATNPYLDGGSAALLSVMVVQTGYSSDELKAAVLLLNEVRYTNPTVAGNKLSFDVTSAEAGTYSLKIELDGESFDVTVGYTDVSVSVGNKTYALSGANTNLVVSETPVVVEKKVEKFHNGGISGSMLGFYAFLSGYTADDLQLLGSAKLVIDEQHEVELYNTIASIGAGATRFEFDLSNLQITSALGECSLVLKVGEDSFAMNITEGTDWSGKYELGNYVLTLSGKINEQAKLTVAEKSSDPVYSVSSVTVSEGPTLKVVLDAENASIDGNTVFTLEINGQTVTGTTQDNGASATYTFNLSEAVSELAAGDYEITFKVGEDAAVFSSSIATSGSYKGESYTYSVTFGDSKLSLHIADNGSQPEGTVENVYNPSLDSSSIIGIWFQVNGYSKDDMQKVELWVNGEKYNKEPYQVQTSGVANQYRPMFDGLIDVLQASDGAGYNNTIEFKFMNETYSPTTGLAGGPYTDTVNGKVYTFLVVDGKLAVNVKLTFRSGTISDANNDANLGNWYSYGGGIDGFIDVELHSDGTGFKVTYKGQGSQDYERQFIYAKSAFTSEGNKIYLKLTLTITVADGGDTVYNYRINGNSRTIQNGVTETFEVEFTDKRESENTSFWLYVGGIGSGKDVTIKVENCEWNTEQTLEPVEPTLPTYDGSDKTIDAGSLTPLGDAQKEGNSYIKQITKQGDGASYTFKVESSMKINLFISIAGGKGGNWGETYADAFEVNVNGQLLKNIDVGPVSGWTAFYEINVGEITLNEGENTIEVKSLGCPANLQHFRFERVYTPEECEITSFDGATIVNDGGKIYLALTVKAIGYKKADFDTAVLKIGEQSVSADTGSTSDTVIYFRNINGVEGLTVGTHELTVEVGGKSFSVTMSNVTPTSLYVSAKVYSIDLDNGNLKLTVADSAAIGLSSINLEEADDGKVYIVYGGTYGETITKAAAQCYLENGFNLYGYNTKLNKTASVQDDRTWTLKVDVSDITNGSYVLVYAGGGSSIPATVLGDAAPEVTLDSGLKYTLEKAGNEIKLKAENTTKKISYNKFSVELYQDKPCLVIEGVYDGYNREEVQAILANTTSSDYVYRFSIYQNGHKFPARLGYDIQDATWKVYLDLSELQAKQNDEVTLHICRNGDGSDIKKSEGEITLAEDKITVGVYEYSVVAEGDIISVKIVDTTPPAETGTAEYTAITLEQASDKVYLVFSGTYTGYSKSYMETVILANTDTSKDFSFGFWKDGFHGVVVEDRVIDVKEDANTWTVKIDITDFSGTYSVLVRNTGGGDAHDPDGNTAKVLPFNGKTYSLISTGMGAAVQLQVTDGEAVVDPDPDGTTYSPKDYTTFERDPAKGAEDPVDADTWGFWYGDGSVTVKDVESVGDNGFKFTYNGSGNWYSVQVFYKNSKMYAGTKYTLTFKMNVPAACRITINGKVCDLQMGDNDIKVVFTVSADKKTCFSLQMGVNGEGGINTQDQDVTVTISDVLWTKGEVAEPANYTVKYEAEGGVSVNGLPESKTVGEGDTIKVPEEAPTLEHHTFLYWYYLEGEQEVKLGEEGVVPSEHAQDGVFTLYAKFAEHIFEDGVCTVCNWVCVHTFTAEDGECSVCHQVTGKQLESQEYGATANDWTKNSKMYTMTKPEAGKVLEIVFSATFDTDAQPADWSGIVTRFENESTEQAFLQGNGFSLENDNKPWKDKANADRTTAAYDTASKVGYFSRVIVRWEGRVINVSYEYWTAEGNINAGPDKTGRVVFSMIDKDTYNVFFGVDEVTSSDAKLVANIYNALPAHEHVYSNELCTVCGAVQKDSLTENGFTAATFSGTYTDDNFNVYDPQQPLTVGQSLVVIGTQSVPAINENWDSVSYEFAEGWTGRSDDYGWEFISSGITKATNVLGIRNANGEMIGINWILMQQIVKDSAWRIEVEFVSATEIKVSIAITAQSGDYVGFTYVNEVTLTSPTELASLNTHFGMRDGTLSVSGYKVNPAE